MTKTHVYLIVYLSICAGDEFEQVKQLIEYDPSKKKLAVFKVTQDLDFIFEI